MEPGLRHGRRAQPRAGRCRIVAEDRDDLRRLAQTMQLQRTIGVMPGRVGDLAGGPLPLGIDMISQCRAQRWRPYPNEAPGLAVADRGRQLRQRQQLQHHRLVQRIGAEMAHVAAPGQQVGQRCAEIGIEGLHQYSMPACAFTPLRKGCLIMVISVTRSAASISASGALRPVTTTCFMSSLAVSTASTSSSGR